MKLSILVLLALAAVVSAGNKKPKGTPVLCAAKKCYCAAGATCDTCACTACLPTTGFVNTANKALGCASCADANCFRCSSTAAGACTACAEPSYDDEDDHDDCLTALAFPSKPFYLSAGSCALCTVDNCKECKADGTCLECVRGYGVAADGSCASSDDVIASTLDNCQYVSTRNASICARCDPGFFWSTAAAACTPCATTNCARCSGATGAKCERCFDQYGLKPVTGVNNAYTCEPCTGTGCARCDGTNQALCQECLAPSEATFYAYSEATKLCYGPYSTAI